MMKKDVKGKRIFIICPVRNVSGEVKRFIENYVLSLEAKGSKVHWPPRDTNQNDLIGINICKQNRKGIFEADEVHIYFDATSQGSLFDLGMTFAFIMDLKKKIVLVNKDEVSPTPHKSFQNVILELIKVS